MNGGDREFLQNRHQVYMNGSPKDIKTFGKVISLLFILQAMKKRSIWTETYHNRGSQISDSQTKKQGTAGSRINKGHKPEPREVSNRGQPSIDQNTRAREARLTIHVVIDQSGHGITEQPMERTDRTTNRDRSWNKPYVKSLIRDMPVLILARAQNRSILATRLSDEYQHGPVVGYRSVFSNLVFSADSKITSGLMWFLLRLMLDKTDPKNGLFREGSLVIRPKRVVKMLIPEDERLNCEATGSNAVHSIRIDSSYAKTDGSVNEIFHDKSGRATGYALLMSSNKSETRVQCSPLGVDSPRTRNLVSNKENESLNNLKKDKTLVIPPADKGRLTVIMDKSDRVDKAKLYSGTLLRIAGCRMSKPKPSHVNEISSSNGGHRRDHNRGILAD
ncbi:hypothetical protein CLF_100434 [Clonorchis sinensis]|uniref:Uncharacterized protein n=1 Tax=Clonorchis sinensis TaxID=79923 RepID=G7Y3F8_CLOSI|nr:hypothetical protein CLF_100434 [Clonorchis sinensis]